MTTRRFERWWRRMTPAGTRSPLLWPMRVVTVKALCWAAYQAGKRHASERRQNAKTGP